ncbi:peptidase M75, Imelysin [Hoeflea prorocentri]|uniref:Peptidase M75, Imelysin n=2 Tax=Hoeflea prorocentri TaxID=1922333 RepID=A0A9X3UFZ3_9HYPH|nr:imelysin family protein [Hoeflea prorocentri]MDA5397635.1 peptidase M75, Imelysin [Hoeflea prorocentri]
MRGIRQAASPRGVLNPMSVLAALLILAVIWVPSHASARDVSAIKASVENFAIPALEAFAGSTAALRDSISALCAAPSPDGLSEAQQNFTHATTDWAAVNILRIGPILEDNRLERILFWPDRRGVGLRQVQALLQNREPESATPSGLAQKSVAVQGLAALEFALYGNGSDELASEADTFRCRFAHAAGTNISAIAGELVTEWQGPEGFAEIWMRPGADNPFFRDEKEALGALVSLFSNGLEFYDTMELGSFLGSTAKKDRPKRALFRRSDGTLAMLQTGLEDFRALYDVSGLAELLPESSKWIDDSVRFGFRHPIAALDSLSGPPADLLSDPEQRSKLVFVRTTVRAMMGNFGDDMTAALGLTANFSSLDGD